MFLEDTEDFELSPDDSYARGPESRWDYFREDPLLHVFHSLLHQVRLHLLWGVLNPEKLKRNLRFTDLHFQPTEFMSVSITLTLNR